MCACIFGSLLKAFHSISFELSDGWLSPFRSVTLCSTWLGNFSCEKRNAFEQFNECFQVFITSLNLTKIKNGFNYIFALITNEWYVIGEAWVEVKSHDWRRMGIFWILHRQEMENVLRSLSLLKIKRIKCQRVIPVAKEFLAKTIHFGFFDTESAKSFRKSNDTRVRLRQPVM